MGWAARYCQTKRTFLHNTSDLKWQSISFKQVRKMEFKMFYTNNIFFLHRIVEDVKNNLAVLEDSGRGLYNPRVHVPGNNEYFRGVLIRDKAGKTRHSPSEYFVSVWEVERHALEFATRTLGALPPTIWAGAESTALTQTTSTTRPVIGEEDWDKLASGQMENGLPRYVREKNAGQKALYKALADPRLREWQRNPQEKEDTFRLHDVLVKKVYIQNIRFTIQSGWEWDGVGVPCHRDDWVIAMDTEGYLWGRVFRKHPRYKTWGPKPYGLDNPKKIWGEKSFVNSRWVREDQKEFWLPTAGR